MVRSNRVAGLAGSFTACPWKNQSIPSESVAQRLQYFTGASQRATIFPCYMGAKISSQRLPQEVQTSSKAKFTRQLVYLLKSKISSRGVRT